MSVDPPPEAASRGRSPLFSRWIVLFLAGPVIWYLHFWAVYLAAEAACAAGGTGIELGGWPLLSVFVIVATVLAVAAIWFLALRARRWGGQFARVGALLGVLFAVATLFVGAPTLFLPPC